MISKRKPVMKLYLIFLKLIFIGISFIVDAIKLIFNLHHLHRHSKRGKSSGDNIIEKIEEKKLSQKII